MHRVRQASYCLHNSSDGQVSKSTADGLVCLRPTFMLRPVFSHELKSHLDSHSQHTLLHGRPMPHQSELLAGLSVHRPYPPAKGAGYSCSAAVGAEPEGSANSSDPRTPVQDDLEAAIKEEEERGYDPHPMADG